VLFLWIWIWRGIYKCLGGGGCKYAWSVNLHWKTEEKDQKKLHEFGGWGGVCHLLTGFVVSLPPWGGVKISLPLFLPSILTSVALRTVDITAPADHTRIDEVYKLITAQCCPTSRTHTIHSTCWSDSHRIHGIEWVHALLGVSVEIELKIDCQGCRKVLKCCT